MLLPQSRRGRPVYKHEKSDSHVSANYICCMMLLEVSYVPQQMAAAGTWNRTRGLSPLQRARWPSSAMIRFKTGICSNRKLYSRVLLSWVHVQDLWTGTLGYAAWQGKSVTWICMGANEEGVTKASSKSCRQADIFVLVPRSMWTDCTATVKMETSANALHLLLQAKSKLRRPRRSC